VHARRVEYEPLDGRVRLMEMSLDHGELTQIEQHFYESVRASMRRSDGAFQLNAAGARPIKC